MSATSALGLSLNAFDDGTGECLKKNGEGRGHDGVRPEGVPADKEWERPRLDLCGRGRVPSREDTAKKPKILAPRRSSSAASGNETVMSGAYI